MFASRFWYLLLTVIGGMGVAAFLLAKNTYNRSREEDARELIFKDKSEVTALLNAEARLMIDHLMTLSLDEDVRKVLDESTNSKEGIKTSHAINYALSLIARIKNWVILLEIL